MERSRAGEVVGGVSDLIPFYHSLDRGSRDSLTMNLFALRLLRGGISQVRMPGAVCAGCGADDWPLELEHWD